MNKSIMTVLLIVFSTCISHPAEINVGTAEVVTTINAAIVLVSDGDTINIVDAVHTEEGIAVIKNVTIKGAGKDTTVLQAHAVRGSAGQRVFYIAAGKTVTVQDMTIKHGKAPDGAAAGDMGESGGGILNDGTLTLLNCKVIDNDAGNGVADLSGNGGWGGSGGGICNNTGTVTLTDCNIENNYGGDAGNGDPAAGNGGYGGNGGGIFNNAGRTVTMTGGTISNNQGGAIGTGNSDGWVSGGAVYTQGTVTLSNVTISGNSLPSFNSYGAGIFVQSAGVLTATECTVSSNTGAGKGGGIGIYLNNTSSSISRSLIDSNSAQTAGGGVWVFGSGASDILNLTNVTITGNTVTTDGAGFHASGANTVVNIMFCTVADNDAAGNGGGLYRLAGTVNIKNSIIANNIGTLGVDMYGTFQSQDYNLIQSPVAGGGLLGQTVNTIMLFDPGLLPLADNGGPTQTMAIPDGSWAQDFGFNEPGIIVDQRNYTRIINGRADIGAFEYGSSPAGGGSGGGGCTPSTGSAGLFWVLNLIIVFLYRNRKKQ